jgi:hypothetical protein
MVEKYRGAAPTSLAAPTVNYKRSLTPEQDMVFGQIERAGLTCPRYFGPIFAGKFQFSGMCDSGRWMRKDHEEIEVYGGADRLHPA